MLGDRPHGRRLDGTAAIDGKVGALSTKVDQDLFRRMRQIADVVLVGAETVRKEGYGLVRLSDEAKAPASGKANRLLPRWPSSAAVWT